MRRTAHELLTEDPLVSPSLIGRAYQTQLRRVRELFNRLQAVDPAWAESWKAQERGWRSDPNHQSEDKSNERERNDEREPGPG